MKTLSKILVIWFLALSSGLVTANQGFIDEVMVASAYTFTALVSDGFTGSDSTNLTAHSTDGGAQAAYGALSVSPGGSGFTWVAESNAVTIQSNKANATFAIYSVNVGETDYYMRAYIYGSTGSGNHWVGFNLRYTDNDNRIYVFVTDDPVLVIKQAVLGSESQLFSEGIATFTGKILEIQISGTTLKVWYDGTLKTTQTIDASLTSSKAGLYFASNDAANIDDFLIYK